MACVATLANGPTSSQNYSTIASTFYKQWEEYAIDPSGRHTMLSYQWCSTYSLLYNAYPNVLSDLDLIPQHLYDMQSVFYPTVSQIFGIPLDNRHNYTKSDENMWTAATCSPETRRLFVNALGYWIKVTSTGVAFTDPYETIDQCSWLVGISRCWRW